MTTLAYDPHKAATNFRKHGVSFDEATTALGDRLPRPPHRRPPQLRRRRPQKMAKSVASNYCLHSGHGQGTRIS